jgi:hypothetical protein
MPFPPVYAVFLNLVDRGGLTIEDVSAPRVTFDVVSEARRLMDAWDPDLDVKIAEVTSRLPERLRRLGGQVRHDHRLSWWHEPVTAVDQILVSDTLGSSDDGPDQENAAYESYAQRPARSLLTSSLRDGTTVLHETIRRHVGDLDPSPGHNLCRVGYVSPRIYEIGAASDWHRLCRDLPVRSAVEPQRDSQGRLTPNWTLVRRTFDGVHLSLWGYLTSTYVDVASDAGVSRLWSWDGEQCFWMSPPDDRTVTDIRNPRPA